MMHYSHVHNLWSAVNVVEKEALSSRDAIRISYRRYASRIILQKLQYRCISIIIKLALFIA